MQTAVAAGGDSVQAAWRGAEQARTFGCFPPVDKRFRQAPRPLAYFGLKKTGPSAHGSRGGGTSPLRNAQKAGGPVTSVAIERQLKGRDLRTTQHTINSERKTERIQMKTLQDLFLDQLADVLDAENQLVKALPKMAKNAESPELREAFELHLEETEQHVERLKEVFEDFGKSAKAKKCEAMAGLVKEGKEILDDFEDSPALDAALIAAAQKVEHYEIASYGCLVTWAKLLDKEGAAAILQETLDEEGEADKKLTGIAESTINVEAASEDRTGARKARAR